MLYSKDNSSAVKGTYDLFVGNMASTVILALTAIIVGRLLGPDKYGLYTISLIIPAYVFMIIQFGLPAAATKFSAKFISEGDEEKAISFLHSIAFFEILLSTISLLLVAPFSNFIAENILMRPGIGNLIVFASISIIGQATYLVTISGFQGLFMMKRSALLQVLQAGSKLIVSILLVLAGFGVIGALAGYVCGFGVSGGFGMILITSKNRGAKVQQLMINLKVAFRYSVPIYFANLFQLVLPFISTLLAVFVSNVEIGGYGAAQSMTVLVSLFTYPIQTVLFPLFSKMGNDTTKVLEVYRIVVKYSVLFVVPVTVFLMVESHVIIALIYGSAYEFAAGYFFAMLLVNLLSGLGSITWGPLLWGIGETRKYLAATSSGSVVTILSSLFLVKYFGIYGAIISLILGQFVSTTHAWSLIGKRLNGNMNLRSIVRIYLAVGIAGIITYPITLLPYAQLALALIGTIFFIIIIIPILALSRALNRREIIELQDYFQGTLLLKFLRLAVRYYMIFGRFGNEL